MAKKLGRMKDYTFTTPTNLVETVELSLRMMKAIHKVGSESHRSDQMSVNASICVGLALLYAGLDNDHIRREVSESGLDTENHRGP